MRLGNDKMKAEVIERDGLVGVLLGCAFCERNLFMTEPEFAVHGLVCSCGTAASLFQVDLLRMKIARTQRALNELRELGGGLFRSSRVPGCRVEKGKVDTNAQEVVLDDTREGSCESYDPRDI